MSGCAYERVLDALAEHGSKVKASGSTAIAQCPTHDDRDPSLSVRAIEGSVLLKCHAGCDNADVLAAIGCTLRDLYDEPKGATYSYDDGRIVHRTPDKSFRQSGNTKGTGQLYRLARVREAVADDRVVYVVEGEKDVHAIESIDAVATCSPMGAGKWSKVDSTPLHGAKVIVVADKDATGEHHARDIMESLDGMVPSITVVHAKVGKDAADHIAAGHGLDDFVPVEIAAEPVLRRAKITWATDIEPEPVVWAWSETGHGRIPAGSLSIAAGREGTGKSTWAIWMAAQITTGALPGSYFGKPRHVFYVAVEDSWKHTLVPRLIAAGADLSKVGRFEVVNYDDDEIMLSLPHDNFLLEASITEHDIAMVVIDPLLSVIGEKINTHQSREVRSALDPLARIADRTGSVVMGIAHFNKGAGTDASSLITGSGAFKDVPRTVFGFARDEADDGDQRVMTQTKNSLGPEGPSLSYTLTEAVVDTRLGPAITSRFTFTGESDRSVADLLRDSRSGEDETTERDEAAEWLVDHLTENGGEANAGDTIKAAAGHGIAKRTLQRARKRAGVAAVKNGLHGGWVWSLAPRRRHEGAEGAKPQTVAPSAPSVAPSADCPSCDAPLVGRPRPDCDVTDLHHEGRLIA